jgi:hypothetical protein
MKGGAGLWSNQSPSRMFPVNDVNGGPYSKVKFTGITLRCQIRGWFFGVLLIGGMLVVHVGFGNQSGQ